jgi:hypothetical protein
MVSEEKNFQNTLTILRNDALSDTTGDDSSNAARKQKEINIK